MKALNVTSTIEHKHEGLPRFICIPLERVDPWKLQGATTVEVTMNGVNIGRRSLKRWEDRDCWWMDLSNEVCRHAGVETGDAVKLNLKIASEELPEELARLIKINPAARAAGNLSRPGNSECCAKTSWPQNNPAREHDELRAHQASNKPGALAAAF